MFLKSRRSTFFYVIFYEYLSVQLTLAIMKLLLDSSVEWTQAEPQHLCMRRLFNKNCMNFVSGKLESRHSLWNIITYLLKFWCIIYSPRYNIYVVIYNLYEMREGYSRGTYIPISALIYFVLHLSFIFLKDTQREEI